MISYRQCLRITDEGTNLSCCVDDFEVEFFPPFLVLGQHSICCSGKQMIVGHILPCAKEGVLRHLFMDLIQMPQHIESLISLTPRNTNMAKKTHLVS